MLTDVRAPAVRAEVGSWPDLGDASVRVELTPAAVTAMRILAAAWQLTVEEICGLLGGVSPSSWHSWRAHPPKDLGPDRLTRASLLLGIYAALHGLHGDPLADEWVRLPNTNKLFAGSTPLQAMLSGGIPVMLSVRALLDGRRGGL